MKTLQFLKDGIYIVESCGYFYFCNRRVMKKSRFTIIALFLFLAGWAQSDKEVKWIYTGKKIADKIYEMHFTATINAGYHLSALDPKGTDPFATSFSFIKNPLLTLNGDIKEYGKLIIKNEAVLKQYVRY